MAKGLAIDELEVGIIYKCQISGNEMLIIESEIPVQKERNKEGNLEEVSPARKVIAGKWAEQVNGMTQFKLDEVSDGQLVQID